LCLSHEEAAARISEAAGGKTIKLAGTGSGILKDLLPAADLPNVEPHPQAEVVARIASGREPQSGPVSPLYLRAPDAKLPGGLEPAPK